MIVQERYAPVILGVNEARNLEGSGVGGFICRTAGTITLSRRGSTSTVVLDTFPVSAGAIYGLSMYLGTHGYTVTLAGGASGTLLTL